MRPSAAPRIAIAVSCVSLMLSAAAMTLSVYPESKASALIAHPFDAAHVAFVCMGRQAGERVGDLFCGIGQ